MPTPFRSCLLVSTLALLPNAVAAQDATPRVDPAATPVQAVPAPTPTPSPVPLAPPPVVATVPPAATSPAAPSPTASPSRTFHARATPRPVVPRPRQQRRTSEPVVAPAPVAAAMPTPVARPTPAPSIPPAPFNPAPNSPGTAVAPARSDVGSVWWWIIPIAAAVLAAIGWLLWRRRGRPEEADAFDWRSGAAGQGEDDVAAAPDPDPLASPLATVAAAPRAWLTVALRPTRAGVNLLSATVEAEVTVTNTGDAPAVEIRTEVRLISAHAGQDAELAAIFADAVARPAALPFALASGEQRRLRVVAALPHDSIRAMTAAGRPMFVPVVAVQVRYAAAPGVEGQTAASFAVGVERVDSSKLAPLWLDQPARMHDQVAARAQGTVIER